MRDGVTPYTYDRLDEALQDAELVVLGVNSLGIDWAGQMLADKLPPDVPLLFLTKGLAGHDGALELLPHALRRELPPEQQRRVKLAAVGGPSIAGELAANRHTCVVVTGSDAALLEKLARHAAHAVLPRLAHHRHCGRRDLRGDEEPLCPGRGLVGGLLERDGMADNDAVMYNLAAGLFAQGLWETAYMVDLMGGQRRSVFTLPGAGDLYVTSMGGRNSAWGGYLGLGVRFSQAKAAVHGRRHHRGRAAGAGHRPDGGADGGGGQARRSPACR